jgi:hypothetical protein
MQDAGQKPSRLRFLLDFLKRLLGKKPTAPPGDPYACAMASVRRGSRSWNSQAAARCT